MLRNISTVNQQWIFFVGKSLFKIFSDILGSNRGESERACADLFQSRFELTNVLVEFLLVSWRNLLWGFGHGSSERSSSLICKYTCKSNFHGHSAHLNLFFFAKLCNTCWQSRHAHVACLQKLMVVCLHLHVDTTNWWPLHHRVWPICHSHVSIVHHSFKYIIINKWI